MPGQKDEFSNLWWLLRPRLAVELRDAALRERDDFAEQLTEMRRQRDEIAGQLEAALAELAVRTAQPGPQSNDADFQMRLDHRRTVLERRPTHVPHSGQSSGNVLAFVHLAKTGGVTLTDLIRSGLPASGTLNVIQPEQQATAIGTWSPASAIKALLALPDTEREQISAILGHYGHGMHAYLPKKVDYITLLRDPVDRIVSAYYYSTAGEAVDTDGSLITLDDYVFRKRHYDLGLDNYSTRVLSGDPRLDLFDPLATTGTAPLVNQADFETAREHLRSYAFVGVLERFDEFILILGAALGWSLCDLAYKAKNRTASRPTVTEIAPETRAQILRWNQFDAELHREAERMLDERVASYPWDFEQDLSRLRQIMQMQAAGAEVDELRRYEIDTLLA